MDSGMKKNSVKTWKSIENGRKYAHPNIWQSLESNQLKWAVHAMTKDRYNVTYNVLHLKLALALAACLFRELLPKTPTYEDLKKNQRKLLVAENAII